MAGARRRVVLSLNVELSRNHFRIAQVSSFRIWCFLLVSDRLSRRSRSFGQGVSSFNSVSWLLEFQEEGVRPRSGDTGSIILPLPFNRLGGWLRCWKSSAIKLWWLLLFCLGLDRGIERVSQLKLRGRSLSGPMCCFWGMVFVQMTCWIRFLLA